MGFQNSAPRFDNPDLLLQSLHIRTRRADAAITNEVPWAELLQGTPVHDYVVNHYKNLVEYCRSKNLKLRIYINLQNGLDRSSDARELQHAAALPAVHPMGESFNLTMRALRCKPT